MLLFVYVYFKYLEFIFVFNFAPFVGGKLRSSRQEKPHCLLSYAVIPTLGLECPFFPRRSTQVYTRRSAASHQSSPVT
jgi:hypothetical protein